MVNIACIISNGYDILLIEQLGSSKKREYTLPECSAESTEAAQLIMTERLRNEGILFDFDEILYENKTDDTCQMLFLCYAFRWTNQTRKSPCKWVEVCKLENCLISSAYKELLNRANNYFVKREKILSEIKCKTENMYNQSQVKIVIDEQFDSITFWLRHSDIYVPFCLKVAYIIKCDNTVDFQVKWQTCRQYAPGDKSDLYMLFAETMALLLKLFNEPVFVCEYNVKDLEPEINGAEIIFEGDKYSGTIAESDFAEKVIDSFGFFNYRQAKENALLRANRDFKWVFPVNPSRFEHLIVDILECRYPDSTVHLVGGTNNPDGGRDIIICRGQGEKRKLTICQCKAYQQSVNKSHVRDIRDMLDYYDATGFFLAVTSNITVPLIDHLTSLSKRYDVNWWTEREVFKALQQYPAIADKLKLRTLFWRQNQP